MLSPPKPESAFDGAVKIRAGRGPRFGLEAFGMEELDRAVGFRNNNSRH